MDETEAPLLSTASMTDGSVTDGLACLEKHVLKTLNATLAQLQSDQKDGSLETSEFKEGVQKVLNSTQASLFLRTVPLLLDIPLSKGSLTTEQLIQKTNQTTQTLMGLCRDQATQTLALKAGKILEQIEAKEQLIRDQVALKQKAIAKLVQDRTASVSKR